MRDDSNFLAGVKVIPVIFLLLQLRPVKRECVASLKLYAQMSGTLPQAQRVTLSSSNDFPAGIIRT